MKEYILYIIDKLLKKPNLDNGFIEMKPEDGDYVHEPETLGFVAKEILVPDRNWKKYRSKGELQKRSNKETMACVTFSAFNCLEQIVNFYIKSDIQEHKEIVEVFNKFGLIKNGEANFSDRYIAKLSGTTMRGNNQKNVAEAIRKYGLVPESDWPFDASNYYKTIPGSLISKGKALLDYIEINYEWVHPSNFNDSKLYGPTQTSVYAWPSISNGIYQRTTMTRNHAVDNDYYVDGQYDGIFDSYEPFDKKVAWNFDLGYGMLFTIHLKKSWYLKVENFLKEYDGKNVKSDDSPNIFHIQNTKKKLYPDWLSYLSWNGLENGFSVVDQKLIDSVENGDIMDIKKSIYWKFIKHLDDPDNMSKLLEILHKN